MRACNDRGIYPHIKWWSFVSILFETWQGYHYKKKILGDRGVTLTSTIYVCLEGAGCWHSHIFMGVEALTSGVFTIPWWRNQIEAFSALLAICAGNWPVTGEFPSQRLVTRSFDVFLVLHLNKRLSKHCWVWWFEAPSHPYKMLRFL